MFHVNNKLSFCYSVTYLNKFLSVRFPLIYFLNKPKSGRTFVKVNYIVSVSSETNIIKLIVLTLKSYSIITFESSIKEI